MPGETTTQREQVDSRAERSRLAAELDTSLMSSLERNADAVETVSDVDGWNGRPAPDTHQLTLYGAKRSENLTLIEVQDIRGEHGPWGHVRIFDSTLGGHMTLLRGPRTERSLSAAAPSRDIAVPGVSEMASYGAEDVEHVMRLLETGTPEKPDLAITRQAKKFGKFAMRHVRSLLGRGKASSEPAAAETQPTSPPTAERQSPVETPQRISFFRGAGRAILTDIRNGLRNGAERNK